VSEVEEVRLAVQAALLNSECPPLEAVKAALEAIAEFHLSETDAGWNDLLDTLSRTYEVQEKSIRA
jgi:hypothetical protein